MRALASLAYAVALLLPVASKAEDSPLSFTTLTKRVVLGPLVSGPRYFVARSSRDLEEVLQTLRQAGSDSELAHPSSSPPVLASIDFNKSMVIGVIVRSSSSLCAGVTVNAVAENSQQVLVKYSEQTPSEGTYCAAAIGAAYHLVQVKRKEQNVTFEASNPSIERTKTGWLRHPVFAAHVKC